MTNNTKGGQKLPAGGEWKTNHEKKNKDLIRKKQKIYSGGAAAAHLRCLRIPYQTTTFIVLDGEFNQASHLPLSGGRGRAETHLIKEWGQYCSLEAKEDIYKARESSMAVNSNLKRGRRRNKIHINIKKDGKGVGANRGKEGTIVVSIFTRGGSQ